MVGVEPTISALRGLRAGPLHHIGSKVRVTGFEPVITSLKGTGARPLHNARILLLRADGGDRTHNLLFTKQSPCH